MYLFTAFILVSICANCIQGQAVADDDWKLSSVVDKIANSDLKDKPIGTVVSELTQKATAEFDKLYHQLETVLKQLTNGPTQLAKLNPSAVNDACNCYCRCPRDTVSSKVVDDVKLRVMDLKNKFLNVGKSVREKIHQLTGR